ncbi:MAG: permease, partial [Desulfobacula sp.]|uniref:permease n=1 Tax=Desulfobacula sp. TaxID=2593537 RepID=UPI0025BB4758
MDILLEIGIEVVRVFNEAAIYILFGFFIAGVLHSLFTTEVITRYLGGRSIRSIFLAALAGIPLPLCSCSVLPTAISLRKHGASKGSTLSFLISTPETGADSISLTYALMDPIMTIVRPLSALITAISAG